MLISRIARLLFKVGGWFTNRRGIKCVALARIDKLLVSAAINTRVYRRPPPLRDETKLFYSIGGFFFSFFTPSTTRIRTLPSFTFFHARSMRIVLNAKKKKTPTKKKGKSFECRLFLSRKSKKADTDDRGSRFEAGPKRNEAAGLFVFFFFFGWRTHASFYSRFHFHGRELRARATRNYVKSQNCAIFIAREGGGRGGRDNELASLIIAHSAGKSQKFIQISSSPRFKFSFTVNRTRRFFRLPERRRDFRYSRDLREKNADQSRKIHFRSVRPSRSPMKKISIIPPAGREEKFSFKNRTQLRAGLK